MRASDVESSVVFAATVLLARLGSKVLALTLALLLIEPDAPELTVTVTVTLAFADGAIVPILQVTTPADCPQLPCEAFAVPKVTLEDSVSVTTTLSDALRAELLATPIV